MTDTVGSEPLYEAFADAFEAHAAHSVYNAHLDRPACLELLGDVAGKTVLDVACGPGLYAQELTGRGARVLGCDISPRMVELAEARVPSARFRVHDLGTPLDWVPDASVDLVLFALAIEYLDDRVAVLRELRRVLRQDGALVLSKPHPFGDWQRHGGNYFEPHILDEWWQNGRWHVRYWVEPLESTCAALAEAGFLIERLVEPRPADSATAVDPVRHERLSTQPTGFVAIRAIPDPRPK